MQLDPNLVEVTTPNKIYWAKETIILIKYQSTKTYSLLKQKSHIKISSTPTRTSRWPRSTRSSPSSSPRPRNKPCTNCRQPRIPPTFCSRPRKRRRLWARAWSCSPKKQTCLRTARTRWARLRSETTARTREEPVVTRENTVLLKQNTISWIEWWKRTNQFFQSIQTNQARTEYTKTSSLRTRRNTFRVWKKRTGDRSRFSKNISKMCFCPTNNWISKNSSSTTIRLKKQKREIKNC